MAGNPTGRPPKPAKLRVIEGNRGKRRVPNAPKATERKPVAPRYPKNSHEARAWKKLVADLGDLRLLSANDREAMVRYCDLWGVYMRARADVKRRGPLTQNREGVKVTNPAWRIMRDAHRELVGLEIQFGKLPVARSRIDLPPELPEDEAAAVFA